MKTAEKPGHNFLNTLIRANGSNIKVISRSLITINILKESDSKRFTNFLSIFIADDVIYVHFLFEYLA